MIRIRAHHLEAFVHSLVSDTHKNLYIRNSYSEDQSNAVKAILQDYDAEDVQIVLGIDDICKACPYYNPTPDQECLFDDSIWDAKEFMYKIMPGEIVTKGYLKQQYLLYMKAKNRDDWKKIIIGSRKNN